MISAMNEPLLTTKLYMPSGRPQLLARPSLIDKLNASLRQGRGAGQTPGFGRKLTLVSAPAGFGKTTLVSTWLEASQHRYTWLSVDEGDNDPTRFLIYFVAALQKTAPGLGQDIQAMMQSLPPAPEAVMTTLINEMASRDAELMLVLDDYHLITAEPIHQALTFFIEHLPAPYHLVIISRADPPFPLARLRARGQMLELRVDDLRFTEQDIAAFLQLELGLTAAAPDITALANRTEGWIVGLQLAVLSIPEQADLPRFIAAFKGSHRYILDYLTDEVLNQRSQETQDFLLQTSVLSRLCGPLCDAVTGRRDGQTMLEHLERANLFIVPLDDERRWYRYHHLFAELLQSRLQHQLGQEGLGALHQRASVWYETEGWVAEAIYHALAAVDFARVARLIEHQARAMVQRGEMVTLRGWMDALPDALIQTRPRLCLEQAAALVITFQLEAAEAWLQETEQAIAQTASRATDDQAEIPDPSPKLNQAERQELQGEILAWRAVLTRLQGQIDQAIDLSQEALAILPESEGYLRGILTLTLGMAQRMAGNFSAASQIFAKASAVTQAAGHLFAYLIVMRQQTELLVEQGQLQQAAEIYRQALNLVVENKAEQFPPVGLVHLGLGELHYQWNDLAAAERHLERAIALELRGGHGRILIEGPAILAWVKQAQGDSEGARQSMAQAVQRAQGYHETNYWVRPTVTAHQARLWLVQGDVAAAAGWAQEQALRLDGEISHLREFDYLTLARLLMAQNQFSQARLLLERLSQQTEAAGRLGGLIESLLLQSLAYQAENNLTAALIPFKRVLTLAEPAGYIRLFVDEGPTIRPLLNQTLAQGFRSAYTLRLLVALPEDNSETTPLPGLPEPLTPREREVLRLIAAGLSNRDIAETLIISYATVKRHVSNIYGKLGVPNRAQAILKAQELNLDQ